MTAVLDNVQSWTREGHRKEMFGIRASRRGLLKGKVPFQARRFAR